MLSHIVNSAPFQPTGVAPGTVANFASPKTGDAAIRRPLNRKPGGPWRYHGLAGKFGDDTSRPIRDMASSLESAVLLPDPRPGKSLAVARQDLLARWGVPASTSGLPDAKSLLQSVINECVSNTNPRANLGEGLDTQINALMAHILQGNCSDKDIDSVCVAIHSALSARSVMNSSGRLTHIRLRLSPELHRLMNVISTHALQRFSRMEDMPQAQRMLAATFFRHVAHEVEHRAATVPTISVQEAFSPQLQRLVVAHLALVSSEYGHKALTTKEKEYLTDMIAHETGWESARELYADGIKLNEMERLVRQQMAHFSMETHQSTARPVAVADVFPDLPEALSTPAFTERFTELTKQKDGAGLTPFMALLHMSEYGVDGGDGLDLAALKHETKAYLSRSGNPQALINKSIGVLYQNRSTQAGQSYRGVYDEVQLLLSQLNRSEVSVSLAPGDVRRGSGHAVASEFEDQVLPLFFTMSASLEDGGTDAAAGRKFQQLAQRYRETLAHDLGLPETASEVSTTVDAHLAPLRQKMMEMGRTEEKVQRNRSQMAAVLVAGDVTNVMPALKDTGVRGKQLLISQRSVLEQRFIRQLGLVIERIELALGKAETLPRNHPQRQSLLALRRRELMAVTALRHTLTSPESNQRERKIILDNLIHDPTIFREWLGTSDGVNPLTDYLEVVDYPFAANGKRAKQLAPNTTALRFARRRFTATGSGHTALVTQIRVANVRQKLMQAIAQSDEGYTNLSGDELAFLMDLIKEDMSGMTMMDAQVRQLLFHPVVASILLRNLNGADNRDYQTWRLSEANVQFILSKIPTHTDTVETDTILFDVPDNSDSGQVNISLTEYVCGWGPLKTPVDSFTSLASRIPQLSGTERRVLSMALAQWAMAGDSASLEQQAMVQLYKDRYLDGALLDKMTQGLPLSAVEQRYVDALVSRVAGGEFSVPQSEAKLLLYLISQEDAFQVQSRLTQWQAHYETCCAIEGKFAGNAVGSMDDFTVNQKQTLNRLYLRVVSAQEGRPPLGALERSIVMRAMQTGLIRENKLFLANAMCQSIMARVQQSVSGLPPLTRAEHAFIQEMPQLIAEHKWPIGRAADTVLVLYGDPNYDGFSPPLSPDDRDMLTARVLDARVDMVYESAQRTNAQGVRDLALRRVLDESMHERVYGMGKETMEALKLSLMIDSGESMLMLEKVTRDDGRPMLKLSPGGGFDSHFSKGDLLKSIFQSGADSDGLSLPDAMARVRRLGDEDVRLDVAAVGSATARQSKATGLQRVLEQFSGSLAPMNTAGSGAVVAPADGVVGADQMRDAVARGMLDLSYVAKNTVAGFEEEHILVTLPLAGIEDLDSNQTVTTAMQSLITVAEGKVRFAIKDETGHVFYVDGENFGGRGRTTAIAGAITLARQLKTFKSLGYPHRLETVLVGGKRMLRVSLDSDVAGAWDKWHGVFVRTDRRNYWSKANCMQDLIATGQVQFKLGATPTEDIVFCAPLNGTQTAESEFYSILDCIKSHRKTSLFEQHFRVLYGDDALTDAMFEGYFNDRTEQLRAFAKAFEGAMDNKLVEGQNSVFQRGYVVGITVIKDAVSDEEREQLNQLLAAAQDVWGKIDVNPDTLPIVFMSQDGSSVNTDLTNAAAVGGWIDGLSSTTPPPGCVPPSGEDG